MIYRRQPVYQFYLSTPDKKIPCLIHTENYYYSHLLPAAEQAIVIIMAGSTLTVAGFLPPYAGRVNQDAKEGRSWQPGLKRKKGGKNLLVFHSQVHNITHFSHSQKPQWAYSTKPFYLLVISLPREK